jgi:hypothetical protein
MVLIGCNREPPSDLRLVKEGVRVRGGQLETFEGSDHRVPRFREVMAASIDTPIRTMAIDPDVTVRQVSLVIQAARRPSDEEPVLVKGRHHLTWAPIAHWPLTDVEDPCALEVVMVDGDRRSNWTVPAEAPGTTFMNKEWPYWPGIDAPACGAGRDKPKPSTSQCSIRMVLASPDTTWGQAESALPASSPASPVAIWSAPMSASDWKCGEP